MPEDICQISCADAERVGRVKSMMAPEEHLFQLAEIFKAMGDPTRARILHALSIEELCVCDIASLLGMSHSAVSHQLRLLRTTKLVRYRKEGKVVYYSLLDSHVQCLFEEGLRHVTEG